MEIPSDRKINKQSKDSSNETNFWLTDTIYKFVGYEEFNLQWNIILFL